MQQFTVPQFIDVEDKIIGPITTRQFVIMLAGFLLIGISYKLFDFSLFLTLSIIIFGISGTFSFAKINGRPFHFFVLNLMQTLKKPSLRIWSHDLSPIIKGYKAEEEKIIQYTSQTTVKHYTMSRLAELSLIVDTKGVYQGEESEAAVKIESASNLNF